MHIDTAEPHRLRQALRQTSDLGVTELLTKAKVTGVLRGYGLVTHKGLGTHGIPKAGQGNVAPDQTIFNGETGLRDQPLHSTGCEFNNALLPNDPKFWAIQARCGLPR